MSSIVHQTTRPVFLRLVPSVLRRTSIFAGVFAMLSVGQIDLGSVIGEDSPLAFKFTSAAEAAVARRAVHRPVQRPVHRPAHRPVHHPVHRPVHPVHRPIHGRPVVIAPIRPIAGVRPWYWGRVVAGVAIGTIIGVGVVGTAPAAPSPELCWYWTDSSMTRGYWNYCAPPPPP
jgi:hypothetical protein